MSDSTITIAMASFPPRRTGMIRVVSELLPQCDRLCLYLNNYDAVPAELPKSEKLEVILAGAGREFPDKGSQGKLHWIGLCPGYYLTVDDDIFYPPDYASSIVAGIEKYGRKAIVGYHGSVFKLANGVPTPRPRFMRDSRVLYRYDAGMNADTEVHMLGNAAMGCHPATLGLSYETLCRGELHSGDDEDVAVWAQANNVKLVCLAHKKSWLRPDARSAIASPLHSRTEFMVKADAKLRGCKKWVPEHREPRSRQIIDRRVGPVRVGPVRSGAIRVGPVRGGAIRGGIVRGSPQKRVPGNTSAKKQTPGVRTIINRNVVPGRKTERAGKQRMLPDVDVQSLIAKVPPTVSGVETNDKSVVVAMATFPPRREGFIRVVEDLLPQCDKMYVYMNGYTEIPEELPKSEKLQLVLAGPGCAHPDIGSHGKFYWAGLDDGYYFTVDDDLLYPPDYVEKMTAAIERWGRKAIITMHGTVWRLRRDMTMVPCIRPWNAQVGSFRFSDEVKHDSPVHVAGCGCTCMRAKELKISSSICSGVVHSGDDPDLAIWAQKNEVPIVRAASPAKWIGLNGQVWSRAAMCRRADCTAASDAKFFGQKVWKYFNGGVGGVGGADA